MVKIHFKRSTRYFGEVKQDVLYKIRNDIHFLNCGLKWCFVISSLLWCTSFPNHPFVFEFIRNIVTGDFISVYIQLWKIRIKVLLSQFELLVLKQCFSSYPICWQICFLSSEIIPFHTLIKFATAMESRYLNSSGKWWMETKISQYKHLRIFLLVMLKNLLMTNSQLHTQMNTNINKLAREESRWKQNRDVISWSSLKLHYFTDSK